MSYDKNMIGLMMGEYEASKKLQELAIEKHDEMLVRPPDEPKPMQARTLSRAASVLLVEDGRILIHLDGNIQNNTPENLLAFFINIESENYVSMSPQEKRVWDHVNRL